MKRWYQSRTMIMNLLTLAIGVLTIFEGTDWIMANPEAAAGVMSAIAIVNIYLRKNTKTAIN